MAGWTGFSIGVSLSNLLYFQMQSIVVFWMIIGITSLIIVLIVATNINNHMLWITAIFGSYLFIISLSLFVGRWPVDLNLPKLQEVGAVIATEPNYFMYMGIWLVMSCVGVASQCYILWYYKKTGKKINPKLQEAIDNFEYGRSADQIKLEKERKELAKLLEQQEGQSTNNHDSIILDMQSRTQRAGS